MKRWERKKIMIARQSGKEEITAHCYEALAVHKEYRWYAITHIPSGLRVTHTFFEQLKNIKPAVERLESQFDWYQHATDISNSTEIREAVKALGPMW